MFLNHFGFVHFFIAFYIEHITICSLLAIIYSIYKVYSSLRILLTSPTLSVMCPTIMLYSAYCSEYCLFCIIEYRAPLRCIHDPTFEHSSIMSSSGVI
jgi:ABC-type amino acid transport system permease subunit